MKDKVTFAPTTRFNHYYDKWQSCVLESHPTDHLKDKNHEFTDKLHDNIIDGYEDAILEAIKAYERDSPNTTIGELNSLKKTWYKHLDYLRVNETKKASLEEPTGVLKACEKAKECLTSRHTPNLHRYPQEKYPHTPKTDKYSPNTDHEVFPYYTEAWEDENPEFCGEAFASDVIKWGVSCDNPNYIYMYLTTVKGGVYTNNTPIIKKTLEKYSQKEKEVW